jgi:RND family efflux transporter MFP subunit
MARMGGGQTEAVSVKAYKALKQPISTFILSNTSLEAIRKVTVFARVNAIVQRLGVEEGSVVKRGQVVAWLDEREIRNEFSQAQIAVDQAEYTLKQAEVRAELSAAEFERAKTLRDQTLISQQEYDQSDLASRTDALALDVAGQQVGAAKARLEAAQIQLDYTEIRSSIDGVITSRMIEVGTRVSPNQEVFEIAEYPPLWARIYVPEKELPQLRLRQVATLRVQAYPEERFEGLIKMISPTIDPESGTVKVTLELRKARGMLRPGMFGTVYIATETHPEAIVIPKRAIMRERDENRVFVVQDDSTVRKQVVALGFNEEDKVEIVDGLNEGDIVVTVGQEGLNDDYPIKILAWDGQEGELPQAVPKTQAVQGQMAARGDLQQPSQGRPDPGSGQRGQRRQGQSQWGGPGQGRGGAPDPERMKAFLERMLQNPVVKEAYENRLKEDPGFTDDPDKLREFMSEMRQHMGRGRQ